MTDGGEPHVNSVRAVVGVDALYSYDTPHRIHGREMERQGNTSP